MSNRKYSIFCMAFVCAATLASSEAFAGARTMGGQAMAQRKGCRDLVTLKHPDAKGAAKKAEWDKCMANPDSYN